MTSIDDTLAEVLQNFRDQLARVKDALNGACTLNERVELGTILWTMVREATALQDAVKDQLRDEAVSQLNGAPGTVTFPGLGLSEVTVTIPEPRLALHKDVDFDVLERVLGGDFVIYFDREVKVKPRQTTAELVAQMDDGQAKTLLLAALQEQEGTPRVSFKPR